MGHPKSIWSKSKNFSILRNFHRHYIELLNIRQKMSGADSPTTEQLPKMSSDMQTEVAQRAGLKHVQTKEKNVLPTKEDLEEERKREDFKQGIQTFDSHKLHHVEAKEKCVLPSVGDIAKEKTQQLVAEFDKSELKHVEPKVKTGVEVIDKPDQ